MDKKYVGWSMPGCARIDSLANTQGWAGRAKMYGVPVLLASGGFDPIHPGHISYLRDCVDRVREFHQKAHGRTHTQVQFIVAVNSDRFLELKKGKAFMPLKARCQVVSAVVTGLPMSYQIACIVVPFLPTNPDDMSVSEAIEVLQPTYFCKGGDRTIDNIPETAICKKTGTTIITECGDEKYWSSSNFLKDYEEFVLNRG